MKAKGRFISFLLIVDCFFGGYAAGLNSRQVEVVDPSLPAFVPPKAEEVPAKPPPKDGGKKAVTADAKKDSDKKDSDKKDSDKKDSDKKDGGKKAKKGKPPRNADKSGDAKGKDSS